jgi:hypothetical protein
MHDATPPNLREIQPGDIEQTAALLIEMQAH